MNELDKPGVSIPIYARKLKKAEIQLKKDHKTNWGRFLDGHYDPQIHRKPFGVAMKAPNTHYKYSQSGLSHHYKTIKILEKLSVEEQNKRHSGQRKFQEISCLQEDDIYVFIEYCSNSERTQLSTRHIEEKYEIFAKRFRQGIIEKFPFIKVFLKSHSEDEKITKYTLGDGMNDNIIENQRPTVRIGAFEISIARKIGRGTKVEMLFSKLSTRLWPNLPLLLQKIANYLPKTNLVVTLFNSDDAYNNENMQDIKVTIKLSYKESKALEELRNDIDRIHSGKINEAIKTRESLVIKRRNQESRKYGHIANQSVRNDSNRLSIHSGMRPASAKTRFTASLHQSLLLIVKENNEFKQQNGIRPLSAFTAKGNRPQTAATAKATRTLDNRVGRGSYSVKTLPRPLTAKGQKKGSKGKKVDDLVFTAYVNENNEVEFEGIPKGVYQIESSETPFYQKSTLSWDLWNWNKIHLPLDRQMTSCTSLFFIKTKQNSSDFDPKSEEIQYFEDLQVRAWLLHKRDDGGDKDETELSSDGDETDYEEEFYYDKNRGWFRCGLVPGTYLFLADGEGIAPFSETFEIGEGDFTQEITPPGKIKKMMIISVKNGIDGENLSGVIIRFKKQNSRNVSEEITDDKGNSQVIVEDTGAYIVEAEKKGFINSRQEIYYTKINQDMNHFVLLMMPVEAPQSNKPIITQDGVELPPKVRLRMIFYTDQHHEAATPLLFIKGSNEEEPESIIQGEGEFTDEGRTYAKIQRAGQTQWFYAEVESNQDEWIRITSQSSDNKTPNFGELDKHILTNIKMQGVRFSLYSDNRELGHVSPSYKNQYYNNWDIGYLNPLQKKFLQTNMFVNNDAIKDRRKLMKSYFKFVKYLNSQNQYFNISLIFGFNEGTFKFDDYYISPEKFFSRLKQLDVQWYSENLPENSEKALEQKNDVELFQSHLTKSFMNIFGEISLKQVAEKLSPHIGLNHRKSVSK